MVTKIVTKKPIEVPNTPVSLLKKLFLLWIGISLVGGIFMGTVSYVFDPNREIFEQCPDCREAGNACIEAARAAASWSAQNLRVYSFHWNKNTGKPTRIIIEGDFQNGFGAWRHDEVTCYPTQLDDGSWYGVI